MSQDSATNTISWWKLLAVLFAIVLAGGYVAWEHEKGKRQKATMMHSSKNLRAIASPGQQYILDQAAANPEAQEATTPLLINSSKSGFILNAEDVSRPPQAEVPTTPEQAEMLKAVSKSWKDPIIYEPGMDVKLPGGEATDSADSQTNSAAESSTETSAEPEPSEEAAP